MKKQRAVRIIPGKLVQFVLDGPNISLIDAKKKMLSRVEKNKITTCQCCFGRVAVYYRTIYGMMAACLINLYRAQTLNPNQEWFHADTFAESVKLKKSGGGDVAKLAYWGLVVTLPAEEESETRCSGFWKITEKGKRFATGKITVASEVILYQNRVFGFTGEQKHILECLGEKFNYQELMSGGAQNSADYSKELRQRPESP